MAKPKKIHRSHPHGGVVCDHKNPGYEETVEEAAVTCLKCQGILSGDFGGKPDFGQRFAEIEAKPE